MKLIYVTFCFLLYTFIDAKTENMKFELPQLPYAQNALEPVISEKTIQFHYGKHLQAYINNLNKLIEGTPFEKADLETIVKTSTGGIFNNAAQAWNHQFYFMSFGPGKGGVPKGKLAEAINKKWGSFEKFQKEFEDSGVSIFGSGWVWLVKNKAGELEIVKAGNAENPMTQGMTPILTFDVWEHAYYLDYQNRRPDHLKELWKIINWDIVESRYI